MTEKQKYKLLRKINRSPMTYSQIARFCTMHKIENPSEAIDSLCRVDFLRMASQPNTQKGYLIIQEDDAFSATDLGRDYISEVRKDALRFYLPIAISVLALIVAVIGWFIP